MGWGERGGGRGGGRRGRGNGYTQRGGGDNIGEYTSASTLFTIIGDCITLCDARFSSLASKDVNSRLKSDRH